jgi:hypothetical protein
VARELDNRGIGYELADNAFVRIDDWAAAQRIADALDAKRLHRILDRYAARFCPVFKDLGVRYHWSMMQVEYASDIAFKRAADLGPLYESISRTAIHAVKADQVATFLGRKLHGNYEGEAGSDYHTRIEGTRIKHHMGRAAAIKMYDKRGRVLRIETTVNDVSFFKHHREVEHRDGSRSMQQAPMKKTIYSLGALLEQTAAANRRYLQFVSQMDEPSVGVKAVQKIAEPVRDDRDRSHRGFNLLQKADHRLLVAVSRGEFNIHGMSNTALRRVMPDLSGPKASRILKRLRLHGLIKKVARTYRYYLTRLGRAAITAALKLRDLMVIPTLAQPE